MRRGLVVNDRGVRCLTRLFLPDQGTASPPRRGLLAKLGRVVTVMQAIGAVLAVPFGMTGAYSVYSNNLSTEATCKGLRGSIVAAIDKNVDLDTRRRLIRRDVEAFEQSCAGFDPDAVEAFRIVLTKDGGETVAAPAMPPAGGRGRRAAAGAAPRLAAARPAAARRRARHQTRRHPPSRGQARGG